MSNSEVAMTLRQCVDEVLGILTGLDLDYNPNYDRFRAVTRALNRALRANATEQEWSYYSDLEQVGYAYEGDRIVPMRSTVRPRIINDDAVRLTDAKGTPLVWAYFLPRDAIHKYGYRRKGLWVSHTKTSLEFSRPFNWFEEGLAIEVPVMREPRLFRLPELPTDPSAPIPSVPQRILEQELDFDYPDVVIMRAAYFYAQTDPLMQPRVQTLEEQYKDLMYQLIERDTRNTDTPYQNTFILPIDNDIYGHPDFYPYPVADKGWY